ncbi:hypothetical protein BGZ65_005040, partial [Modicella reniformis]
FRHQSQKLLRAWTTQDSETHAIQWKLRQRPLELAKPWLRARNESNLQYQRRQRLQIQQQQQQHGGGGGGGGTYYTTTIQQQQQQQQQQPELDPQQHQGQGQPETVLTLTQALQLDDDGHHNNINNADSTTATTLQVPYHHRPHRHRHHHQQHSHDNSPRFPFSTVRRPSPVVNALNALRINTQLRRPLMNVHSDYGDEDSPMTTTEQTVSVSIVTGETIETTATGETTTTAAESDRTDVAVTTATVTATATTSTSSEHRPSIWNRWKERIRVFREQKVWLIEMSLRECQLDEYELTVPSPVYCDYRLPAYDDVMAPTTTRPNHRNSDIASTSSRVRLNRYQGEPPAYDYGNDDSEEEEEEEEEDDDDDESDREVDRYIGCIRRNMMNNHLQDELNAASGVGPSHRREANSNSNSVMNVFHTVGTQQQPQQPQQQQQQQLPQMTMIQRPSELASILILSSSTSSSVARSPTPNNNGSLYILSGEPPISSAADLPNTSAHGETSSRI